jgi:hypothetical protein
MANEVRRCDALALAAEVWDRVALFYRYAVRVANTCG